MKINDKKTFKTPTLRFPEFQGEWITTTFGDETEYVWPTKYMTRNYSLLTNGIPVLTANKSFILGYTNDKNNIWNNGNCFIMDDLTLDSKYVSFPFKVRSSTIRIIISKNNNIKFVYELFKNLNIKPHGHMAHWISFCSFLKINIPNIDEQNKIAQFLSLIDRMIELQRKLIESNNSLIKTLKSKMILFKLRFKEFSNINVKDPSKTFELGMISNIRLGREIIKNYIKRNAGEYPVISSNTLNNGILGYINTFDYDGEYILTTRISGNNTNSRTFFYHNGKFSPNGNCFIIEKKLNIYNTKYLTYFLKENEKKYLKQNFKGSTRITLTTQELFKHKVILPNILEQNKIVDFLNLLDKKNELNNLILNNHLILKKALINLLFI